MRMTYLSSVRQSFHTINLLKFLLSKINLRLFLEKFDGINGVNYDKGSSTEVLLLITLGQI
jgi:hypothetical protein